MDVILKNDVKNCIRGDCEACSRQFDYTLDENQKITCAESLKDKLMKYIEKLEAEAKPQEAGTAVDHPKHYNRGMECIDEMIAVFGIEAVRNFCLLNVWKYRYRAASKGGEEDLKKSDWYMKKYIELAGDGHDNVDAG